MKVVIIVQARMTSTRLPGKVLMKVLDKPLLAYQIERLKKVKKANEIVIATTVNSTDDPVENLCRKLGVKCFRGSEDDVLSRYYDAATLHSAEAIVRITADCPLIDNAIVDKVISQFLENDCEYVSNTLVRTYPRGMDTEVFSYRALADAYSEGDKQHQHEHVTPFIWERPERYNLLSVENNEDYSSYRWTVDTHEDFELIKNILECVYPNNMHFSMQDCLDAYADHPEWRHINSHVEQKKI